MNDQLFPCEQLIRNQRGRVYCKVLTDGRRMFACSACGEFFAKDELNWKMDGARRVSPYYCKGCMRTYGREHKRRTSKQARAQHRKRQQLPKHRAKDLLRHARKRHDIVTIDVEWIEARLLNGHCEATGLPFVLSEPMPEDAIAEDGKRLNRPWSPWSPSIDRIDRRFGYTPENSRVVVLLFNLAKNEYTDADVLLLAKAVAENPERLRT